MRFVLHSKWFPVCVAVHLARAATRLGHDFVTCGPTERMPWPGVARYTFPRFPVDYPTIDEALALAPDLWIDVDGGIFADRALPCPRVLVATDPHVPGAHWSYKRQRELVDDEANVFMMQSPYCLPGEKWLPYGYDPEWFRPMPGVVQDHDVTVLGAPYPERRRIAFALRERGLRVLGPGFGGMGASHARELCRAPVAVVWPLADDLPGRVFEAAACGREVLTLGSFDLHALGAAGHVNAMGAGCTVPAWVDVAEGMVREPRERAPARWAAAHAWDARLEQLLAGRASP